MARTPGYDELVASGEALRARLATTGPSVDAISALVNDVRVWQRRCAWAVVARTPRAAADFRVDTGPFQRSMGPWIPTRGWQPRLDDVLLRWLSALDRVRRLPG